MPDTRRIWFFGEGKPPFMFDAVFGEDHESTMVATENPVETGVPMTDHAYRLGDRLEIEAGVGDVWLGMRDPAVQADSVGNVVATGALKDDMAWLQGEGGGDTSTRSQRAFQLLRGLQRSAAVFGVQTGLLFYPEMFFERLKTKQDKDTGAVVYFTASLREILRFGTETATFPARKKGKTARQASKKANNGEKKAEQVTDPSAAYNALFSGLGDKVKGVKDALLSGIGIGGP